jgi:hypothetical protein
MISLRDLTATLPKVACEFRLSKQLPDTAVTQERPYSTPIFLLAPGRCYSSVVCAMLGQHPELYGVPETQLLVRDTMQEWWNSFGEGIHSHGLVRSVAEIVYGFQSVNTARRAREWLWQQRNLPTHVILSKLSALVFPLRIVEKTPMATYRPEHMRRILNQFPDARFIHLVRNPISSGESLIEFFHERGPRGDPKKIEERLQNVESIFFRIYDTTTHPPSLDPTENWFIRQYEVMEFLSSVPEQQQMRIRGEDLMSDPDTVLRPLCEWLGIRSDTAALQEMKHPERSPFASFGPPNARHGGDPKFFRQPEFRPGKPKICPLDSPLPWRADGCRLKTHVQELARSFGYR